MAVDAASESDVLRLVERGLRRGWNAHEEGVGLGSMALRMEELARGVLAEDERLAYAPVAEPGALFAGEKAARLADPQFRCPEHDVPMVEGKCPERRCPWKIETFDAPRLTREIVEGPPLGLPTFKASEVPLRFCSLCGCALLALGEEGSAIAAVPDFTERHRAWHDRLERLLEAKG